MMHGRLGALALLLSVNIGCGFWGALPEGVDIHCVQSSDCPAGQVCQLGIERCVDADRNDVTAPTVLAADILPRHAADGAQVVLTLQTDEALAGDAHPRALRDRDEIPLSLIETDDNTHRYALTLDAAAHAEGVYQVFADLVDESGNASVGQLLGSFTADYTPPTLVTDSATVAPTLVGPGASVFVSMLLNEPVVAPELTVDGPSVITSVDLDGGDAALITGQVGFEGAGLIAGEYTLLLADLTDRAGNVAQSDQNVGTVTLSTDAPEITMLEVPTGTRYSKVDGFNRIEVDVHTSGAAAVSARLGSRVMTCTPSVDEATRTRCETVIGDSDDAGAVAIVASAFDALGNIDTDTRTVILDFAAPTVVGGLDDSLRIVPTDENRVVSPNALSPLSVLEGRLFFDEQLGAHPTADISIAGGAPLMMGVLAVEQGYDIAFTPEPIDETGTAMVEIAVVDTVGNIATLTTSVPYDDQASDIAALALSATFIRAPWGSPSASGLKGIAMHIPNTPEFNGHALGIRDETENLLAEKTIDGATTLTLTGSDRRAVTMIVTDPAGNTSLALPAATTSWRASLGEKTPGDTLSNPHRVEVRLVHGAATYRTTPAIELGGDAILGVNDDLRITATGAPRWSSRGVATTPEPRSDHALVFDENLGRLLMLGGDLALTQADTLWAYDEWGNWSSIFGSGTVGVDRPPNLRRAAMVYDRRNEQTVVMGGDTVSAFNRGDVWTLDADGWQRFGASTLSSTIVGDVTATWSRTKRGIVAYRASDNRTLQWTGTDFDALDGAGPVPSRTGSAMAAHEATGAVFLFCGLNSNSTLKDIWRLSDEGWVNVPVTFPQSFKARAELVAVYDPLSELIVFGLGRQYDCTTTPCSIGEALSDLYTFDPTTTTVTRILPGPSPAGEPPLFMRSIGAAAAYDPQRRSTVIIGGRDIDEDTHFNTVEISGTQVRRLPSPDGFQDGDLPFLPDALVAHDGELLAFRCNPETDVWALEGNDWHPRPNALGGDSDNITECAMAVDADSQTLLQFGGIGVVAGPMAFGVHARTYAFNFDTWTWSAPVEQDNDELRRRDASMAFDRYNNRFVLLGGRGVNQGDRRQSIFVLEDVDGDGDYLEETWSQIVADAPLSSNARAVLFGPSGDLFIVRPQGNFSQLLGDGTLASVVFPLLVNVSTQSVAQGTASTPPWLIGTDATTGRSNIYAFNDDNTFTLVDSDEPDGAGPVLSDDPNTLLNAYDPTTGIHHFVRDADESDPQNVRRVRVSDERPSIYLSFDLSDSGVEPEILTSAELLMAASAIGGDGAPGLDISLWERGRWNVVASTTDATDTTMNVDVTAHVAAAPKAGQREIRVALTPTTPNATSLSRVSLDAVELIVTGAPTE